MSYYSYLKYYKYPMRVHIIVLSDINLLEILIVTTCNTKLLNNLITGPKCIYLINY